MKKNILIVANTGLGNLVLKTPLFSGLKKYFIDHRIHVLSGMRWGEKVILEMSREIDEVIAFDYKQNYFKKLKCFKRIAQETHYDYVFIPFDDESGFLNQLLVRIAFSKSLIVCHSPRKPYGIKSIIRVLLEKFFSRTQVIVPLIRGRHEIDLNLDLLEYLNDAPILRSYKTSLKYNRSDLSKFGLKKSYIVFQIAARHGLPTPKIWRTSNFLKLSEEITKICPKLQIVLVGNKGDMKSFKSNVFADYKSVKNLVGKTNIDQLCSILMRSKAVIANDSGVMHMANALECNLIALMGPSDYTRTRPLGKNSKILYSKNDAFAKMYGWKFDEDQVAKLYPNGEAMDGIRPIDVKNELKKILDTL